MSGEEKIIMMLKEMKDEFNAFREEFNALKQEVNALKEEVSIIKNAVLKIEIEHGEKLEAMGDGCQLLFEIGTEIRTDIAWLKGVYDSQNYRIKRVEAIWKQSV